MDRRLLQRAASNNSRRISPSHSSFPQRASNHNRAIYSKVEFRSVRSGTTVLTSQRSVLSDDRRRCKRRVEISVGDPWPFRSNDWRDLERRAWRTYRSREKSSLKINWESAFLRNATNSLDFTGVSPLAWSQLHFGRTTEEDLAASIWFCTTFCYLER